MPLHLGRRGGRSRSRAIGIHLAGAEKVTILHAPMHGLMDGHQHKNNIPERAKLSMQD